MLAAINNICENSTVTLEKKYTTIRSKLEADLKICSDMENSLEKRNIAFKFKETATQFINMRKLLRLTNMTEATAEAMANDIDIKYFKLMRSSLCLKILKQPELLIEFADHIRIYEETERSYTLHQVAIKHSDIDINIELHRSVYKQSSRLMIPLEKSVLVYDTMRKVSQEIEFPDLVSSVETVNNNVCGALPNKGVVVCPTENKKMRMVLKTHESCIGIVKSSGLFGCFYVTVRLEKVGQLRKYTSEGKLDDVLKSNEKGDTVFTYEIGEVKLSKDEKKIYVVDTVTGIVIVSVKPFSLMKIISNVKKPIGIALIQAESMFILLSDGKVTQTIDDGKTFYTVIEKGNIGEKYHSICWDGFDTIFVICSQDSTLYIQHHQLNFKKEY
ncbi:uncharacterized protein LOC132738601 [Ruditapes philippinarum]|uniref:uncharacterized protein LOC132738601 n=1 Tax=Ruditapes philippinarum TaxID=129788 RepID=UPI00295BEAAC|nr:uncharacterized protein LOC132738601 [Ruditapes philippinarum]